MSRDDRQTVHLLFGFDAYYPAPDNTIRVFADEARAREIRDELEATHGRPDHKERYADLRERYPWLPAYSSERYDVVSYEVAND